MSRVAIVTGGTRGIGAAIAKRLKDDGYQVAATYAGNDEKAKAFENETGIRVYKWDVASPDECKDGIAKVESDLGPVEILVNNAGITKDAMFHKMTPEHWRKVLSINLDSRFNMTQPVWEGMRSRGFGRIVNISSINGQKGQMGQANYATAKAGDMGFTKTLAQEGARKGITVNTVAPGYINTEMMQTISDDIMNNQILPHIPVGRLGEPEEIARCVAFLVADEAGYITGSTLTANGGQYMD